MFSEPGPSYLWERHPYDTVSGALPISLQEELHDEHNVQLAANQRTAQESEEESEEQLDEQNENEDENLDAEESEEPLDEQDEYEDEDLDAEQEDEDQDEEEDDDVEDEASVVEEQRVDDALAVSTEVTVASSFYDIDRLKAVAAEIAGVSPEVESPAARGRRAEGGRASRASWAKIRTIERFTNDGVSHPRYAFHQSSEEDDGD
jgi:hypothetical protein